MKRLFTSLAFCAMALATFTSCDILEPKDEQKPDPEYSDSELTPAEHKLKLEDIALELIDEFNPTDFEVLAESLFSLSEYLAFDGEYDEYSESASGASRALKSSSVDELTDIITRASEQFIIDIHDGIFEYDGYRLIFNEEGSYAEELNSTGSCEVAWDNAVVTLTWGKNNGQYTYYDEEEDIEYVVMVPSYINASFKIDGVEHLNVNVEPTIIDNYTYAPKITVKINGGYLIVCKTEADSQKLRYDLSLSKSGKKLINQTAEICINGFTDVDNWIYEYEYEEGYTDTVLDPESYVNDNTTTAQFRLDVLALSIIGNGNIEQMKKEVEKLDNNYNDTDREATIAYWDKVSDILNKYIKVIAVYNDTDEKIAEIKWQSLYSANCEGDVTTITYGSEPILVFPDGSKFSLEDYFTAASFGRLMERFEEFYGE